MRHVRGPHTDACQPTICDECSTDDHDEPWPCDAARLVEEVRARHDDLEWLGHIHGSAEWWANPLVRECVPCDGCRAKAQEMADALAPWRARLLEGLEHV